MADEFVIKNGIVAKINPSTIEEYGFTGEVLSSQTAGTSIAVGQVCYLRTNGKWFTANSSQVATGDGILGIALNAASLDEGVDIFIRGVIGTNNSILTSVSSGTGQPIYLATSAGTMSTTAPSSENNIVRILGHYLRLVSGQTTKYVISFNPDGIWLEL